MLNELQTKWLAALRSGQYKQGKQTLRSDDNKFCCLGVALDIYDNSRWGAIPELLSDTVRSYRYTGTKVPEVCYGSMPVELKPLFDLSNATTSILMNMNDLENKTFSEIADFLEELWTGDEGE